MNMMTMRMSIKSKDEQEIGFKGHDSLSAQSLSSCRPSRSWLRIVMVVFAVTNIPLLFSLERKDYVLERMNGVSGDNNHKIEAKVEAKQAQTTLTTTSPPPTTVSIIPIVTMRRSSSTYLASDVMEGIPCHLSLKEVVHSRKHMGEDAWEKDGKFIFSPEYGIGKEQATGQQLAQFVRNVAQRRCREYLDNSTLNNLAQTCDNHCFVNFKLHEFHLKEPQHIGMWQHLQELTNGNEHLIILERTNITAKWQSLQYSEKTGEWENNNRSDHKIRVQQAQGSRTAPQHFIDLHDHWYKFARESHPATVPVLDLTYDQVTSANMTDLRSRLVSFLDM